MSSKKLSPTSSSEETEQVFNRFDANGDGKICSTELAEILRALGSDLSEKDLANMMAEMDRDGDGFVDIKEFSEFYSNELKGKDGNRELQDAFNLYDKDKNGVISAIELHTVLKNLGGKSTMKDCKKIIGSVDIDGDGNVNFEEFKMMMGRI